MEWAKRLERLKDDKTVLEKNQIAHFFFFLLVSFIPIYYFYYDRRSNSTVCVYCMLLLAHLKWNESSGETLLLLVIYLVKRESFINFNPSFCYPPISELSGSSKTESADSYYIPVARNRR